MSIGESARRPDDRVVRIPETFSFIDDPDGALVAIKKFVRFVRDGARIVSVTQAGCTQIDLCAASVLNALALDATMRLRTAYRGEWPRSEEAREIVEATGLPSVLNIVDRVPHFDSFGLRYGGATRESLVLTSAKEKVASEMAGYIRNWFREHDYEFSFDGMDRIAKLVGETLTNAEDHSSLRMWWAAGYLRKPRAGRVGDCHLTFFNFGDTLASSLQRRLEAKSPLRQQIQELVAVHQRKQLFDRSTWTSEELWTLYALQDGVTAHYDTDPTRGFGTGDLIEEFQELGQTKAGENKPMMCVISGHSHILFDSSRYRLRAQPIVSGSLRRVIAFNEGNDLEQRPDSRFVQRLQHRFPGTLISLRFFLDREYLKAIGSKS